MSGIQTSCAKKISVFYGLPLSVRLMVFHRCSKSDFGQWFVWAIPSAIRHKPSS